jgi:hypothetical protein
MTKINSLPANSYYKRSRGMHTSHQFILKSSHHEKLLARISKIKPINLSSDDERTLCVNKKRRGGVCRMEVILTYKSQKIFFVDEGQNGQEMMTRRDAK